MTSAINIAGRLVGPGHPAFLIGEMSANHDRDLKQALALMDLAADAGVDAVKLQTYDADTLTIKTDHPSARVNEVLGEATLYDLYKTAGMPYEFHQPLFDRAAERGIMCFSTVYDLPDIDFLEKIGNPVYKVASFELVHLPLLRALGKTGKPVILSTGMATIAEVEEGMEALWAGGCKEICVLHCCSSYPAPPSEANLAAMDMLRAAFHVPVGFSDHTEGTAVPVAAVARGANAIEKHYTNDRNRPGPDHRFSLAPHELVDMVQQIRAVEAAIGDGIKRTSPAEEENKAVGRRSIFAIKDIRKGEPISAADVRIVRPSAGLHPRYLDIVVGRRAARDIKRGWPITWDDV
jgi:pseudaminic acid synthase